VKLYREALGDTEGLELPGDPSYPHDHAHHLFVVKIAAMERKRFMERLSEYNIGYGLHFPACHLLKYVRNRFGVTPLPETERAAGRIMSLPLFPDMSDGDVAYVCEAVREILKRGRGGGSA
jgi:UDP-4-amino-4-deoxy-L-arabinose-oxoglutarate aminotransferase